MPGYPPTVSNLGMVVMIIACSVASYSYQLLQDTISILGRCWDTIVLARVGNTGDK